MSLSSPLRAASVLSLILVAGHTYGLLGAPSRGLSEVALFQWMRMYRFDAMGFTRSHWDFYRGLSLFLSFSFLLLAALLWQLAAIAEAEPLRAKPMIGTIFFAYLLFSIVGWVYFFAAPAAILTAAASCLGMAFFSKGR